MADENVPLEGFAYKAESYGAPTEVCRKLPQEWPDDITQALRNAGYPPGPGLAELERNLAQSRPTQPGPKQLWRDLQQEAKKRFVQTIVVALLAISVALIKKPIPFAEAEISLWINDKVPIILPDKVSSLPLSLTLEGNSIERATLVEATVLNSGTMAIASDDEPKPLTIFVDENARIATISELSKSPKNLRTNIIPTTSFSNSATIELGYFEPSDQVVIQLLILDPENVEDPHIDALTERGDSSTRTIVTNDSYSSRLYEAYQWWVLAVIGVPLFALLLRDFLAAKRYRLYTIGDIFSTVVGLAILTLITTAIVTRIVVEIVQLLWL